MYGEARKGYQKLIVVGHANLGIDRFRLVNGS